MNNLFLFKTMYTNNLDFNILLYVSTISFGHVGYYVVGTWTIFMSNNIGGAMIFIVHFTPCQTLFDKWTANQIFNKY